MYNENRITKSIKLSQLEVETETKIVCYFCNRDNLKLFTFPKCCHKICISCFYERLFSNHIYEFHNNTKLEIKCKCEIGFLQQSITDIYKLIKAKAELDKKEEEENLDENSKKLIEGCDCSDNDKKKGKKYSEYFCLDCFKYVCQKCKSDIKGIHIKHRVLNSKNLIRLVKDNITNMKLKNENMDNFIQKCDKISEKFEDLIGKYFNDTLEKLDDLIRNINNIKETYIKNFKEELGNYIKIFRIIKIFYLNYYKDKANEFKNIEAEKNNIFKLKYLNNISCEFIDMELIQKESIEKKIEELKSKIEELKTNNEKIIKGEFLFEKIKKGYRMGEKFQAHKKYINGLISVNNTIITSSTDFQMKVWDPNYTKNAKQSYQKKILSLLSLKDGNILASSDNNIFIYEFNEDKKQYEIKESLTNHDRYVYALGQLDDGTLVSGAADKKIIFYEKKKNSNYYSVKQIIETDMEITDLICIDNFRVAYIGNVEGIIKILGAISDIIEKKIVSSEYTKICDLPRHKGKVNCLCRINHDYFVSGGGDTKKKLDHSIYIWKPFENKYKISQILKNAHLSEVNSIILLRDGRFASSSKDHTIKIWSIDRNNTDNHINYILSQCLNQYNHGLYKMVQLDDDRIVSSTSNNELIIWINTEDIF